MTETCCPTCGQDTRGTKRSCVGCNAIFFVTPEESAWLRARNYTPYVRCQPCRQRRKAERAARPIEETKSMRIKDPAR